MAQGKNATFSQHAAAQKKTIIYYVVLFVVALPILLAFFIGWFVPMFHLSAWFIVFAIASELLQHSVTIIPEVGDWKTKWHQFLTACSAILLIPMLLILLVAPRIGSGGKAVAATSLVLMAATLLYVRATATKGKPKNLLLLQVGYYGCFFAAILAITYLA